MPWVKIDEEFASHPKVLEAGPLGMALQIAALCYCNRHLTNGHLSRAAAMTLLSFEGLGMRMWANDLVGGGEDASWELVVEDLVTAGLWHEIGHDCPDCPEVRPGGYYLHDYLNYQPSKAEVEAEREAKRRAGSAGGKASAQARAAARGQATAAAERQAESKPDPVPDPDPENLPSSSGSSPPRVLSDSEEDEEAEHDRVFAAACWVLAERVLASMPPGKVRLPQPWLVETRRERMYRHVNQARRIFEDRPDITAEQLADILEPDPNRPRSLQRVYRCETCKDTGQVRNDDDLDLPAVLVCPNCSAEAKGA